MNVSPPMEVTCSRKKIKHIMSTKNNIIKNIKLAFPMYRKKPFVQSYFPINSKYTKFNENFMQQEKNMTMNVFQLFSYPKHFLEQQNPKRPPRILVLEIQNIHSGQYYYTTNNIIILILHVFVCKFLSTSILFYSFVNLK